MTVSCVVRFLRCSPFDEYKLWKAQVDNGSRRGGERLNILTQTLLLRRTKDQLDSTGKPLVQCTHTHTMDLQVLVDYYYLSCVLLSWS